LALNPPAAAPSARGEAEAPSHETSGSEAVVKADDERDDGRDPVIDAPNRREPQMSIIPYNELAELLLDTSSTAGADESCCPEETADAIIDALSLTQLREHLLLHLTIDSSTVDF
jgi:hypothetical protein